MSKKKSKDYSKASQVEEDIKELIEQGFLKRVKSNGSAYFVITEKGLALADIIEKLSKPKITFIADFDIDEPTKH
jgi:predicted transcriptional regulator|tara:strand:+ start:893 stop:1117 length:225 start_codon:yes stop_codon:yes gene_type:complete